MPRRTSRRSRTRIGSRSRRRSPRSTRTRPSWRLRGPPGSRSSPGNRWLPTRRSGDGSSVSPARTARARRPVGWSTSWWRPVSTRVHSSAHCSPPTTPAALLQRLASALGRLRRGGGRVRRQLRCLPPRRRGPDERGVGPPGRVSRRGRRRRDVRAVGPAGARGCDARRERRGSGSREHRRGARGLVGFDRRRTRSWTTCPRGSNVCRRRSPSATGPRQDRQTPSSAASPPRIVPGRPSRSSVSTRMARVSRPASRPPAATTRRMPSRSRAPRQSSASPRRHRHGPRIVPRRRPPPRAKGRSCRRRRL